MRNITLLGALAAWGASLAVAAGALPDDPDAALAAELEARLPEAPTPAAPQLYTLFTPAALPAGYAPRAADGLAVQVDRAALAAVQPQDQLALLLGPADLALGIVQGVEVRSPASFSVFGVLDGDPDSRFILVHEEDVAVGLIDAPARAQRFRLDYAGADVNYIAPVRIDKPDCALPGRNPATVSQPDPGAPQVAPEWLENLPVEPQQNGLRACGAQTRLFDAMIYYTPSARAEAGGTNAMNAQCQLAVDTANQTYADSQISARLLLVYRAEISYTEAGEVEVDRDRLQNTSDGIMDGVHATRNTYGGDFVSLFVRNADSDACGIAYCTPSGSAWGFCIVDWTCASGNFSYAHEIGHLQGCAHNEEDAGSGCNEYCDSYGHRFFGVSGTGWRTLMSYNNAAESYTRIGRWSNPNITFDGRACGRTTANCNDDRWNSKTVDATAVSREYWRSPRFNVWVAFGNPVLEFGTWDYPFNTVAEGVNAVFGGSSSLVMPTLWIKNGQTNQTITISKRMRINACGGTARIGG